MKTTEILYKHITTSDHNEISNIIDKAFKEGFDLEEINIEYFETTTMEKTTRIYTYLLVFAKGDK